MMDRLTKREIEHRLKGKGLSGREAKIMVAVLSDTLRDMKTDEGEDAPTFLFDYQPKEQVRG
jgi:hypothetical protein